MIPRYTLPANHVLAQIEREAIIDSIVTSQNLEGVPMTAEIAEAALDRALRRPLAQIGYRALPAVHASVTTGVIRFPDADSSPPPVHANLNVLAQESLVQAELWPSSGTSELRAEGYIGPAEDQTHTPLQVVVDNLYSPASPASPLDLPADVTPIPVPSGRGVSVGIIRIENAAELGAEKCAPQPLAHVFYARC